MKIVERTLSPEQDGIYGYLAEPERAEPGPALLMIHQNTGLTDYLKIEALKFAKLGYTTVVPALYSMLGHPSESHILNGRQIQAQTSDAEFVREIARSWDYLLSRPLVDPSRVAVSGYCMGGRIAIHFVAATPQVRAFVGYYPTVREEPETEKRPRHPSRAAREITCPSIVLYGADDIVTTIPIQERMWEAFRANGERLEWHFFPMGGHGFVDPGTPGYQPHVAELAWPLVVDFMARELDHYPAYRVDAPGTWWTSRA